MHCKICKKDPSELEEYIDAAKDSEMPIEDYVREEEGTYNPLDGSFYCTNCYIIAGMPTWVDPSNPELGFE